MENNKVNEAELTSVAGGSYEPDWNNGVDHNACIGCGNCVENCPVQAVKLNESNLAEIDEDYCVRCGNCENNCPLQAISPTHL